MNLTLSSVVQIGGLVVALAMGWATMRSELAEARNNVGKLETRVEKLEDRVVEQHVEELNARLRFRRRGGAQF